MFLCDNIISQPNHLKKSKLNVGIPTSSHVVLTTEEDGKVDQRGCTSPEGVSIYKVMYSKVRWTIVIVLSPKHRQTVNSFTSQLQEYWKDTTILL